jgi:site-specific recombinase XerD
VLGFITAQRTGHDGVRLVRSVDTDAGSGGIATSTVARRLSTISGFFAYLAWSLVGDRG